MKILISVLFVLVVLFKFHERKESDNRVCSLLFNHEKIYGVTRITGSLFLHNGHYELKRPIIELFGEKLPFYGDVRLRNIGWSPNFSHMVSIKAKLKCATNFRNPSNKNEPSEYFGKKLINVGMVKHWEYLKEASSWDVRLSFLIREKIEIIFKDFPAVLGLVLAVWTGDVSRLGDDLRKLYIECGLSHVLALSGQHIGAFSFGFGVLLYLLTIISMGRLVRINSFVFRLVPFIGGFLLFIMSGGQSSIKRAFGMLLFQKLLMSIPLYSSPLQLVSSSVAILILVEPELLASPGFMLSSVASAFLVCVALLADGKKLFLGYFLVSLLMPIFMCPVMAYLFAKISLTSFFLNVLLSWIWSFIFIPLGFIMPFVMLFFPLSFRIICLKGIEKFYSIFFDFNKFFSVIAEKGYKTILCPTIYELIVVILLLLMCLKSLVGRYTLLQNY